MQSGAGETRLAHATLEKAVRIQPSNPQAWLALGRYELQDGDAAGAVGALQAAIYLNPAWISAEAIADGRRTAIETQNDYIQALRAARAQKRERIACASSSAPEPPALRTVTCSKPNSSSSRASVRRS